MFTSTPYLPHAAASPVEVLLERCRQDDPRAQKTLYQRYHRAMLRIAAQITGNTEEAEDVVQEAFVRAFRSLHLYKGEATFGAWLKRIVINLSINCVKRRRLPTVSMDQLPGDVSEEESAAPRPAGDLSRVRQAMTQLPVGYREVLTLYLFEGYDHEEIGSILHISEATSKSQYCRARRRLRELLGAETCA
jgi:RNA polymerase sigma factor (sigma-70 family)